LLAEAAALPVEGWDLARLGSRITIAALPWDFRAVAESHARSASELLDLGTGGGEWLASLAERPTRTVATESWPPNVGLARARLEPLGVTVVAVEPTPDNLAQGRHDETPRLPFPSDSFALVTARHHSFVAGEVARVLAPGGVFLTQQVGGDYGEFHDALGLPRPPPQRRWDLALATAQLRAAGLATVDSEEGRETTAFADVGALAWYLRLIPWTVEGFSIAAQRANLERLHGRIEREGALRISLPAFWLKAVKRR
jgi:SAM-dependent methyltransferase